MHTATLDGLRAGGRAAALGGAGVLGVGGGLGGLLIATLPDPVPGSVAVRAPFWLMGAAVGGRLAVRGPLAGRVSVLNDHGLLGSPQGVPTGSAATAVIAVTPLTVTLLAAVIAGTVVARWARRGAGPAGSYVAAAAMLAVCWAAAAAVLAIATRLGVAGGSSVQIGPVRAAVSAGLLGAVAAAIGVLWATATGGPAAAVRAGVRAVGGMCVIGLPALVVVVLVALPKVVGTLLTGGQPPAGLLVVLAVAVAPVVAWDLFAAALGAPLGVHGSLVGLRLHGSAGIVDLAGAVPALAFLPAVAIAIVLAAVASATPQLRALTAPPAALAVGVGFAITGAIARSGAALELIRHGGGPGDEAAGVATAWWASIVLPAAWGFVAILALRAAGIGVGHRAADAPVPPTRELGVELER
ncbi:MAG: hypothetical protein ACR2FF_10375 [Mycobacteriales bacterium]